MVSRVGLAATFIGGLIEMSGALIGPWLQKITPRAGLLGTVAGVALVWIAMVPSAIIFANPLIGLPVLFVALLRLVGYFRFPLHSPGGLVAIIIGILLGFATGQATLRFAISTIYWPAPILGDIWFNTS